MKWRTVVRKSSAACLLVVLSAISRGADPGWAIPDAPFRAVVKGREAASLPEAGVLIQLPEFGQMLPDLGDVVLTDANGRSQPVARVWRGEGQQALLLAQELPPNKEAHI